MGNFLQKGFTYIDGGTNVSATNLNAHVDEAIIKATAISALSAKTTVAGTEELMINDGGTLKKITATKIAELVAASAVIPPGTVSDFAGTAAPTGWFLCYGQSISRTTYALLFAAIGTTYGSLDSSNFNLPDLRGCVVAGKDDMGGVNANRLSNWGTSNITLGGFGGEAAHTLTIAEMPSHQHFYTDAIGSFAAGVQAGPNYNRNFNSVGTTATGGGAAHNICQPTRIMNKIIKF